MFENKKQIYKKNKPNKYNRKPPHQIEEEEKINIQ